MWLLFAVWLLAERVTAIQVHGNLLSSDDEVRQLAGVEIGSPVDDTTVEQVAARLRATRKFESVQVLKRFASIADPTQVVIVIIVDEGRVRIAHTNDPEHPYRAVRNHWPRLMYQPILRRSDQYGTTYGVRVAVPEYFGKNSRLIVPFAWGGEKQAGVQMDKQDDAGFLNRVQAGATWSQRLHPVFEERDDRIDVSARGEHWFRPQFRVGVTAGVQHDTFAGERDTFGRLSTDIVIDTRVDPALPRNAIYGRAAWTQLGSGHITDLDGRGYVGLFGQLVFGVRAQRTDADPSLPSYLKPIFGGAANVRGFSSGTTIGDSLTATSAELILPITSPLHLARLGVSAFADAGAVTCGAELVSCDDTWKHGFGGSVWVTATIIRLNVAVAHGVGSSTRVHVSGDISF
ncbi:MAG TPA: BamA/TamA family outer membrane protein [Vicinamibacterales bacterium]|nr:BamA/TamA family outer membrane protein [Vicinamibacterales bacterium]